MSRRPSGYTLLELLVALTVFAVVVTAAYAGVVQFLRIAQRLEAEAWRDAEIQFAVDLFAQELAQAVARSTRDALGRREAALQLQGAQLLFTRTGWPSPPGQARTDLRRVLYRHEHGQWLRAEHVAPDRIDAAPPSTSVLLGGLDAWHLRCLTRDGQWLEHWPPRGSDEASAQLPLAIEAVFEFNDRGSVRRLLTLVATWPGPGS